MSFSPAKPGPAFVSTSAVATATQILGFVVAFSLLPACIVTAIMFASTPFEIFIGTVAGCILSVAMVILAFMLPAAARS